MMLLTAGVSHKTAPLAVRERLAVQDSELVAVARSLKPHLDLVELVLLSSCHRVEIYGTTRRAITDGKSLSRLLCSETEDLAPHVCLYKGVAAGASSTCCEAVELVGRILEDDLAGRAIMVIGAGQMAACCVRLLVKTGARSILIFNRSLDRALDPAIAWAGPAVMPPKGMPRQRP